MKAIIDIIQSKFTKSVEIVPPRNGSSIKEINDLIKNLSHLNLDFVSITKGAGGSLRGGSLPLAFKIQQKLKIPALAHFTCRELTKFEIENSLIDHYYLGISNILALRGDPPDNSNEKEWKGEYKYAYQLVDQIQAMNKGNFIARKGFDKSKDGYKKGVQTSFSIAVAAHPEDKADNRVKFLAKKVRSGAQFAITQMLFDAKIYSRFIREVRTNGINIPILPGIFPIDSKTKLEMARDKFKAYIPDEFLKLLKIKNKKEFKIEGIKQTIKLCQNLKKAGACGIHLFIFQDTSIAKEIFEKL